MKPSLDSASFARWNRLVDPCLSADGRWLIYLLASADHRQKLCIVDLESRAEVDVADVLGFELDGPWLAYFSRKTREEQDADLTVRNLISGEERSFAGIVDCMLSVVTDRLVAVREGDRSEILVIDLPTGESNSIAGEVVDVRGPAFDHAGKRVAFLASSDKSGSQDPEWALLFWQVGDEKASPLVTPGSDLLPAGCRIDPAAGLSFSPNGKRLFFSITPTPSDRTADSADEVDVQIWHWRDPLLQTELEHLEAEGPPSYRALIELDTGRFLQLETDEMPEVELVDDGDGRVALGISERPYSLQAGWEEPPRHDDYQIDLETGERKVLRRAGQGAMSLSPGLRYAIWWAADKRVWFTTDLTSNTEHDLTGAIPHAFHDEDHDRPGPPDPYGVAGWLDGDTGVLVYDRFDIWQIDPEGRQQPVSLTLGSGRESGRRFRRAETDPGNLNPDGELLLLGTTEATKSTGFYRLRLDSPGVPEPLLESDCALQLIARSGDGGRQVFSRSSVGEFPDLWVAGSDFSEPTRVTAANPQQSEYNWATAELVAWQLPDGGPARGVLYKPENFAEGVRYPLLVFVYSRFTDQLHNHFTPPPLPQPVINPLYYASNGYLVFVPDIEFEIGYPGDSSLETTVSGIQHLIARGLVDESRIGGNSHSWGGYQFAFMATRTDLFTALVAGAPVTNMTSSYCELRYETGRSRMFEYEQAQSRIGGTLWEMQSRFLDNSPLFRADQVETPLLILHNDHDGAVPWTEGLQLYLALRRLDKPCWLVNYRGEDHVMSKPENRLDWALRLQQFFDHYLKGEDPPDWLVSP